MAVLANAFVLLRTAMATARFGFGDIASAVQQATQPVSTLGKSLAQVNEEFQQLQFSAEEAALSEQRAALNLEGALENLRRSADLPPNSAARREAQLAYEEAELAYRRAKDRTRDLNAEVAKGPEALNKAAANDPFANLNKAQREFAEYLVGLKPLLDELELEVSEAFLPPLQNAVDILMRDLYPVLRRQLPSVARQTGEALESLAESIDEDKVERILRGFTEPFEEGGRSNIQLFGDLLNNVLDIFLQIVEATGPLLSEFLTFLVDKTDEWATKLEEMDLVAFFTDAGEYAGDLGEIIGNVFQGIGNLIGLTTGPGSAGDDMLQWMKDSTETFANMFSEDPEAGRQFFKDAFANARSVLSAIGAFLMEILKLADNPNIKLTFDSLKESAPAFGEMLGEMIDAGPSFADFLTTLIEIGRELTDSNQISAFFDTLNEGAEVFRDFVQSDSFKRLLDNLGPILASLSAAGVIFDLIRFGFQVFVGYVAFASGLVGEFFAKLGLKGASGRLAQTGLKALGGLLKGGLVTGAILFVITKVTEFYDKFVDFRNMVDNIFSSVSDAFMRFMEPVQEIFQKIFGGEGGGGILGALDPLIKGVLERLLPALGFIVEIFLNILTLIADVVNDLLGVLLPVFEKIGAALGDLFDGDILGFLGNIGGAVLDLAAGIGQSIGNIFISILNFGIRAVNSFIQLVANGPFGSFLKDVLKIDLSNIKLKELDKITYIEDAARSREANSRRAAFNAGATTSFGGADRLAVQSATSSNVNNYVGSSLRGMPEYADYKSKGDIVVNNNIYGDKMDTKELASEIERRLAFGLVRGKVLE